MMDKVGRVNRADEESRCREPHVALQPKIPAQTLCVYRKSVLQKPFLGIEMQSVRS